MRKRHFPINLLLASWGVVGAGALLWCIILGVIYGPIVPRETYAGTTYHDLNWAMFQPLGWWLLASLFVGLALLVGIMLHYWANYSQTGKDIGR